MAVLASEPEAHGAVLPGSTVRRLLSSVCRSSCSSEKSCRATAVVLGWGGVGMGNGTAGGTAKTAGTRADLDFHPAGHVLRPEQRVVDDATARTLLPKVEKPLELYWSHLLFGDDICECGSGFALRIRSEVEPPRHGDAELGRARTKPGHVLLAPPLTHGSVQVVPAAHSAHQTCSRCARAPGVYALTYLRPSHSLP